MFLLSQQSGYRVSFLPLIMPHNAPEPLHSCDHARLRPATEPVFISTLAYGRGSGGRSKHGGEYLTFWYVGQIAEDAVSRGSGSNARPTGVLMGRLGARAGHGHAR